MSGAELLIAGAVVAWTLGAAAVDGYRESRLRRRFARWRAAAQEAGLAVGDEPADAVLEAYADARRVRLRALPVREGGATRIEILGRHLAPGLTLRREPRGGPPEQAGPREIVLGDDDFDREVSVEGSPALALALLDAPTRHAVRSLLRGAFQPRGHGPLAATGRVEDGVLRLDVEHESEVAEALRSALDLSGRLQAPSDLAPRLAANFGSEPQLGVRRRILRVLLRDYADHGATREAVASARDDLDAELRLRAGLALGPAGAEVLLGVAADATADDATSAAAVEALAGALELQRASDLLRGALRTRRLATARACVRLLGRHGRGATATLTKVLLVEKGDVGAAAAEALAAGGDPAAQEPLLRALVEGSPAVRLAAAAGLGRAGTRDAVLPLRDAEAREPGLRGAARQAIAEIHARLAGAAHGQLSLAGGEAGQLSMAEDETGRLSFSDERAPG